MHRLSSSFVLGFHGCDRIVGERLLAGERFKPSENAYDWLGPGIYFWERNWQRGLAFAREHMKRRASAVAEPFVVGAVIDLGTCLDLTTETSINLVRVAHDYLLRDLQSSNVPIPSNSKDGLRRYLDCVVITRVHELYSSQDGSDEIDTVRAVFVETRASTSRNCSRGIELSFLASNTAICLSTGRRA